MFKLQLLLVAFIYVDLKISKKVWSRDRELAFIFTDKRKGGNIPQ